MANDKRDHGFPISPQDRILDMAWMAENMRSFSKVAGEQFQAQGRGVIAVDVTQSIQAGHPVVYIPLKDIPASEKEVLRMVRAYDARRELVVMILKTKDRLSVYRLLLMPVEDKPRGKNGGLPAMC